MKLFLKFLYQYKFIYGIFFLFTGIFAIVFFLYNVYIEPIIYAGLLCAVISITIISIHFIHFRKYHLLLQNIYSNLPLMIEKLPLPDNLLQEDFQNIIVKLHEMNTENFTKMKNSRNDSIDYYTVWVHQIKTPISAIQMILQNEDTKTNREISAELFKIEQYAEMALFYIRTDSNSTDLVIKEYDLDSIIKQAIHRYAPMFIRRKIRLVYLPADVSVITDEKWLLFIIEQLLSNAVKYTVKGTVTINYADDVLTISDTGIGISAEDIPRIFEKGYTGMSGRKDRKSTGIGLYLCRRSAEILGHKITVKSKVGEGSAFSIELSREKFDIE